MTDRTGNIGVGYKYAIDETTGVIYWITSDGIARWDFNAGEALSTIPLSGQFSDLSVSPDGRYLVIGSSVAAGNAGSRQAVLFRYDLETMARTEIRAALPDTEGGVMDVAIAASGQVLFTTSFVGSGSTLIRTFNVEDASPVVTTLPVDRYNGSLIPAPDGSRILILQNGISSAGPAIYDSATGEITSLSWGPWPGYGGTAGDIARDGRNAIVVQGVVWINDPALAVLTTLDPGPASSDGYTDAQFSDDGRFLYAFNQDTDLIEVWETAGWTRIGSADPGINIHPTNGGVIGELDLIGDGQFLLLTGPSSVRAIDLVARINTTIEGTNNADDIVGTVGNDTINALDGADVVHAGSGDDIVDGGFGADQLHGEEGDDTFVFTGVLSTNQPLPAGLIDGGAGVDTLDLRWVSPVNFSPIDAATFKLTVGSQTFTVSGIEFIRTGEGNQFIWLGNNYATSVRIEAGAGNDYLYGGALDDILIGGEGDDSLSGNAGADLLYGGGGDDYIEGAAGDSLYGDGGNDRFWVSGAFGAPPSFGIIFGGDGRDLLQTNIAFHIDMTAGTVTAGAASFSISGIEDVEVTVSAGYAASAIGDGAANAFSARSTFGVAGNVHFEGRGGDDSLTGNAGSDTLDGGLGDDVLRGGAGADALIGGDGVDLADYSAAVAGVTASLAAGSASNDGDGGTDTLSGIENLTGSAFNDSLTGNGADNRLVGGAGNDTLDGLNGADVLIGGAGVDVLNGGGGIDTVDYSGAAAGMRAQLNTSVSSNDGDGGTDSFSGIENLTGSAFNDILIGDGAVNVLRGGLGSDTLIGLAGADVLWGGSGVANSLSGGLGDDWYVLEANDSVVETAGEGNDTVEARINSYVLAANVENLIFTGTGNFNATGHAGASTITGGAGDDNLRGRGGVDVLNGGAGIDTVDYSLAAAGVTARLDQMRATNDGDGSTDTFSGVENLTGSIYNDLLLGNGANNVLMGGVGVDTLAGYGGNDVLHGGPAGGNNQLIGGLGDDWYVLDALDTCVELVGEGVDTVEARIGAYVLRANIENLVYTGSTKFVGTGNALDNHITGGAQNDVLRGMGGADTILGGLGNDELQVRGSMEQYTVTAEGSGWRIVDTVGARDGSIYVESIETIRFLSGNTTTALTYPPAAPAALETGGKDTAPEVLPGLLDDKTSDDAFVVPALPDDQPMVLPGLEADKFADSPLVLPGTEQATPHHFSLLAHLPPTGDWMIALDPEGGLFVPPPHWSEAWG